MSTTEQRVAVVTGGARGIGAATAVRLAAEGRAVAVIDLDEAACKDTVEKITAAGGKAVAVGADVSDEAQVEAAVARIVAELGAPTILVNNAGAAWGAPYEEFPESGWDKVVDLNLKAPFFLTQALTPLLKKAATDHLAKVIHIASIDGVSVNPQETYSYAASKAGLIHLTRRMALKLAPELALIHI